MSDQELKSMLSLQEKIYSAVHDFTPLELLQAKQRLPRESYDEAITGVSTLSVRAMLASLSEKERADAARSVQELLAGLKRQQLVANARVMFRRRKDNAAHASGVTGELPSKGTHEFVTGKIDVRGHR